MYDYASDNPDDLHFKAGDAILVHTDQPHEEGWLSGELDGKVGWFPEAYAEPVAQPAASAASGASATTDAGEICVALFPYASNEPGDLSFEAGEKIGNVDKNKKEQLGFTTFLYFPEILKKEADWWTGKIGDRTGVFPYNYVEVDASASQPSVSYFWWIIF